MSDPWKFGDVLRRGGKEWIDFDDQDRVMVLTPDLAVVIQVDRERPMVSAGVGAIYDLNEFTTRLWEKVTDA